MCFSIIYLVLIFYFNQDRLNMPSILVLNGCGINRAGDQAEIAAFCAHVIELDLSHNKLQDWQEVEIFFEINLFYFH